MILNQKVGSLTKKADCEQRAETAGGEPDASSFNASNQAEKTNEKRKTREQMKRVIRNQWFPNLPFCTDMKSVKRAKGFNQTPSEFLADFEKTL